MIPIIPYSLHYWVGGPPNLDPTSRYLKREPNQYFNTTAAHGKGSLCKRFGVDGPVVPVEGI